MSNTRSQLEEVDALIAAAPDDPAMKQLREDLLQLIALEEKESGGVAQPPEVTSTGDHPLGVGDTGKQDVQMQHSDPGLTTTSSEPSEKQTSNYTAQGTFMEHIVSKEAIAEAPDLGSFQPVVYSSTAKGVASKSQQAVKSDDNAEEGQASANMNHDSTNTNATATQPSEKKKKKKKKKSDDAVLEATFELPSHLVPLESDTPAQKLKKQRTAKALKSKFRAKQKEAEHSKRQSSWQTFASKAGGKKRKGGVGGGSIFSTEEGVNARVGVISGGGGRKMTGFADPSKRQRSQHES